MELLLNLVWLMLAVPAILLCWRAPRSARGWRKYKHLYIAVLAVCVWALLFPVVSASDDLSAIRIEFEESGAARTILKSLGSHASQAHHHSSFVAVVSTSSRGFQNGICGDVSEFAPGLPAYISARAVSGRSPPLA